MSEARFVKHHAIPTLAAGRQRTPRVMCSSSTSAPGRR
jgi:hypothetical protein